MNSIAEEKWPNRVTLVGTLLRMHGVLTEKQNGRLSCSKSIALESCCELQEASPASVCC